MPNEHFIISPAATSGTYDAWTTPTIAVPVRSATFRGSRDVIQHDDTGSFTRAMRHISLGAVNSTGNSLSSYLFPTGLMPWLFRSFLTNAAQVPAGSGYVNHLLPQPSTVQPPWFSFQQVWNFVRGQNVRGAVLESLAIGLNGGEHGTMDANFTIADAAAAGGTWSDGSASGAMLDSSTVQSAYNTAAAALVPFRFHEAAIITGANIANSSGELTVSGGTTVATLNSVQLDFQLNAEGLHYLRQGAPTIARTYHNARTINITGSVDWTDGASTYYDAMRAGTTTSLVIDLVHDLEFSAGQNWRLRMTFPRVVHPTQGADFPVVDGSRSNKRQALTWTTLDDLTLGVDLGVSIWTDIDLVP